MRTRRYRGGRRCSGGNGGERWKDRGTLLSQQKITALIAVGGTLLMMISPQSSLASARKAVVLWLFTVLPSMLPFFICTDLLMRSGMHIRLGNLFERPFRELFGVPGVAGFAYISSILSGYPTGAKILGELCEKGQIRRQDVRDILTFCSTSGPLFILGAVGSGMLQSAGAGYIMLAAHYAGSLLTGLFLIRRSALRRAMSAATGGGIRSDASGGGSFLFSGSTADATAKKRTEKKSVPELLSESIVSSFQSLIVIGGYIVLFMILTDAARNLFAQISGQNGFAGDLLTGCLEMTVGCSGVSGSAVPFAWKIAACTFLISFGGLSIAAQSMSVLRNSGVSLAFFLRFKLIHGLLSSVCACTIMKILSDCRGTAVSVFEPADLSAKTAPLFHLFTEDPGAAYSLFFSSSAAALAMAVFYLAVVLFAKRGYSDESSGNHSGI